MLQLATAADRDLHIALMQVLEVSVDLLCYVVTSRQPTLASIAEADGDRGCVGAATATSHNQVRCKTGSRGSGTCCSMNST